MVAVRKNGIANSRIHNVWDCRNCGDCRILSPQTDADRLCCMDGRCVADRLGGVAPRAGRRGLPNDHPDKAVNVNCGAYFKQHFDGATDNGHSWFLEDSVFLADLAATLSGEVDRRVIGSRRLDQHGELQLR